MKNKNEIIKMIEGLPEDTKFRIENKEYNTIPNISCCMELNENIWDRINENIDDIIFPNEYLDTLEEDENPFEALAYWTIYYKPEQTDISVAVSIGLVPFTYMDEFYLGLGGCGMDLSPKLDAYIALTTGIIPENSTMFRDNKYFRYVVGNEIAGRVEKAVRRNLEVRIEYEVKG